MPFSVGTLFEHWGRDITQNQSCFSTAQRIGALAGRIYGNDPSVEEAIKKAAEQELNRLVMLARGAKKTIVDADAKAKAATAKSHDDFNVASSVASRELVELPPLVAAGVQRAQPSPRGDRPFLRRSSTTHNLVDNKEASPKANSIPFSEVPVSVSYSYESHVPTKYRRGNLFHLPAMTFGSLKQAGCQLIDNAALYCSKLWAWCTGGSYPTPSKPLPSNYLTAALKAVLVALPVGLAEAGCYFISATLGAAVDWVIDKCASKNIQTQTIKDINHRETIDRTDNFRPTVQPINMANMMGGKKDTPSANREATPAAAANANRAATPGTATNSTAVRPLTGKSTGRQPKSGRRTGNAAEGTGIQMLTIHVDTARDRELGTPGLGTPMAAAATTNTRTPDSAAPANATTGAVLGLLSPASAGVPAHSPNNAVAGHAAPPPSHSFVNLAVSPKGSSVELSPLPTVATGTAAKFAVRPGETPKPADTPRPQSAAASVFEFTRTRRD